MPSTRTRRPAAKTETLDLRVTPHQKQVLRRAAALRGESMTEFIIRTVEPVAESLVERQNLIELNESAWRAFKTMVGAGTGATPLAKREAAEFLAELEREENR